MTTSSPSTQALDGMDAVQWLNSSGNARTEAASPVLLHEDFTAVPGTRQGVQYQNRLNRHSRQFFTPQRAHVWCESALEAEALLVLSFEGEVRRVASQPMRMLFADGSTHYPDFFGVLANGDRVVYDVKPADQLTDSVAGQFANAARVCAAVGWHYRVLHEAHPVMIRNLDFLRAARHEHYHPELDVFERIRTVFDGGRPIDEGARMANLRHPYLARAHIRHLLWHRYLEADLQSTLDDSTALTTTRNREACLCGA